jgi:nucleotide-binding universal stress UspA family protein
MEVNVFTRILVPLDRSAFSEHALPLAVAVAKRSAGTIHLVHVHDAIRPQAVRPAMFAFETALDARIVSEERDYLESVARRLGLEHGVSVTTTVVHGSPASEIAHYVRRVDCDLVVMTTHGRGGFHRAWLGSNTDKLLRRLRVPMLLVRPPAAPVAPRSVTGFGNVLIAMDGSRVAEAALDSAAGLPLAEGARCTLLRIVTAPILTTDSTYVSEDYFDVDLLDANLREGADYLDREARRAADHWPVIERDVIAVFSPAEAILERAAETNADLIVIGTHARGPVARTLLGSVADKVIRGANVPVFVFPARALAWDRVLSGEMFEEAYVS